MKSGIVIHYSSPSCRLVLRWDKTSYKIVREYKATIYEPWYEDQENLSIAKKEMEKIAKIVLELK